MDLNIGYETLFTYSRVSECSSNYSLEKTLRSGQLFRWAREPAVSGYVVFAGDSYCRVRQEGSRLIWDCFDFEDCEKFRHLLAAGESDAHIVPFMSATPFLREAYDFSKGVRLTHQDPWECLVTFILSQNNNIPRIQKCVDSICNRAGKFLGYGHYGFPKPAVCASPKFHDCGLGYRESYIYKVASGVAAGSIKLEDLTAGCCSLEHARSVLCRIHGVGIKVASCVALFALGHTEAFPLDVWTKRAIEEANLTYEDLEAFGASAGLIQQHIYYFMINRR